MQCPRRTAALLLFNTAIGLLISPPLRGQSPSTGSLAGRVVAAEDGRPLALVQVTLAGTPFGAATDDSGRFIIPRLRPGTYTVRAQLLGYASGEYANILIRAATTTYLEVALGIQPITVQPLQVTAGRRPELAAEVSQFVSLLTAAQVNARFSEQTPELLRSVPGVYMQKTNQGGGSPVIRGLRANRVLLLIDGIRLNNATYRGGNLQYLNTVGPGALERIEVAYGPASALYGSDALGGAIHLLTAPLTAPPTGRGRQSSLSASTLLSSADRLSGGILKTQFVTPKWGVLLHAGYSAFGDVIRGNRGGRELMRRLQNDSRTSRILPKIQRPNRYTSYDLLAKARFQIGPRAALSVVYQATSQENVPRYDAIETQKYTLWEYDPQKRDLAYLQCNAGWRSPLFDTANLTLSVQRQSERRLRQRHPDAPRLSDAFQVLTTGLQMQLNKILAGRHFLVYGLEFYHDRVSAASSETPAGEGAGFSRPTLFPDGATFANVGVFGQLEFAWGPRWRAEIGARYSAFRLRADLAKSTGIQSLGQAKLSPSAATVRAGTSFTVHPGVYLVANLAQGYRAPNLDDVSKLGPGKGGAVYDIPNGRLQPERVLGVDAGVKIGTTRITGSLVGFYNRLSRILLRHPALLNGNATVVEAGDTMAVFQTKNLGRARVFGIEAQVVAAVGSLTDITAGLGFTRGEDLTRREPLSSIPPLFGALSIRRSFPGGWLAFQARFAGAQTRLSSEDRLDLRIPEGGSPGWAIYNIFAAKKVHRTVEVRIAVTNILDLNYREHLSGLNSPGRNFILRVDFTW